MTVASPNSYRDIIAVSYIAVYNNAMNTGTVIDPEIP